MLICGLFGNAAPYDAIEIVVITSIFYIIYSTGKFGSAPPRAVEMLFS
jgi:hypothetical protein